MTTFAAGLLGARLVAIYLIVSGSSEIAQRTAWQFRGMWGQPQPWNEWAEAMIFEASWGLVLVVGGIILWKGAWRFAGSIDTSLVLADNEPNRVARSSPVRLRQAVVVGVALLGVLQVVRALPGLPYAIADFAAGEPDLFDGISNQFRYRHIAGFVATTLSIGLGLGLIFGRERIGGWLLRVPAENDLDELAALSDLDEDIDDEA